MINVFCYCGWVVKSVHLRLGSREVISKLMWGMWVWIWLVHDWSYDLRYAVVSSPMLGALNLFDWFNDSNSLHNDDFSNMTCLSVMPLASSLPAMTWALFPGQHLKTWTPVASPILDNVNSCVDAWVDCNSPKAYQITFQLVTPSPYHFVRLS